MKFLAVAFAITFGLANAYPTDNVEGRDIEARAGTPGMDVSGYQGNVNWAAAKANGAQFAYIKVSPPPSI